MDHVLPRVDQRMRKGDRWFLSLAGSALLLYGVRRRSFLGGILSLAGADLTLCGLTGHHLHEALGMTSLTAKGAGASIPHQLGVQVRTSILINASREKIYEFLRGLDTLPRFLSHLKSVYVTDATHSHWVAHGPFGREIEWDSEIINDVSNEVIAWRSVNSPEVESAGSVRLEDAIGDRGTIVRISLQYLPPAGALGVAIAKVFGNDPGSHVKEDLRRLKQMLEAGEVPTTDGQPVGGPRGRRQFMSGGGPYRRPAAAVQPYESLPYTVGSASSGV
jgi:uncharacterized membrane protein